jgi:hypothetical protein
MDLEQRTMSYISKDEQILVKIRKYINKLQGLYLAVENLSDSEIDDGIEGLALTQCITNLFELASRLDDEVVAEKLSLLSSGRTARMRNISSHDYDAVDWSIAKSICSKILQHISLVLLDECEKSLAEKKAEIKDYTQLND